MLNQFRHRRLVLPALLALGSVILVLMVACSDDDPVAPEQPAPREVSGTLGAAGGTLESADGELKLVVPAGALDADTEITVTEIATDAVPDLSPGMDILNAYSLTPDGLDLAVPATLTVNVDLPVVGKRGEGSHRIPVALSSVVVGDGIKISRLQIDMDLFINENAAPATATITLEGIRQSLGIGVPVGQRGPFWFARWDTYFEVEGSPRVGDEFIALVQLKTSRGVDVSGDFRYRAKEYIGFSTTLINDQILPPDTEGSVDDGDYLRGWRAPFTAEIEGDHRLGFGLSAEVEYDYNEMYEGEIEPPDIRGSTKVEFELEEIVVTTLPADSNPEFLARGLHLGEPEAEAIQLITDFEGYRLNNTVMISGLNGTNFRHLGKVNPMEVRYNRFQNFVRAYGSIVVAEMYQKSVPTGLHFVQYGPNGMLMSPWLVEEDDFGISQAGFLGMNLTDCQAYGGEVDSGGFVVANNTLGSVALFEYESVNNTFIVTGIINSFPDATGNAVTAAVRPGGAALIVTDGTPGQIFTHDRGDFFSPAVLLGEAGDSPRRVRAAGGLVVISNFASDNLTVLTWSETDVLTIVGTVPVGDGPVGIDLQVQNGGNVAVASTGFNDNTYSVTVLSPAGAVVSNTQTALQAGAEGPGHVVWLGDPDNSLMISCNTTGNVAVVDSGLN